MGLFSVLVWTAIREDAVMGPGGGMERNNGRSRTHQKKAVPVPYFNRYIVCGRKLEEKVS
jgi:hypothetical protein